jgi:hypothetical protein
LTLTDTIALKRAIGGALVCTFLEASGRCSDLANTYWFEPLQAWREQHPKARAWQELRKDWALQDDYLARCEVEHAQVALKWGLNPTPQTWRRSPVVGDFELLERRKGSGNEFSKLERRNGPDGNRTHVRRPAG